MTHKRIARYVFTLFAMMLGLAPVSSAQGCRAANDSSANMIQMVKNYALATDPVMKATRDSLRIPAVALSSDVVLITKSATCKAANSAYQAAATGARQTLSGQVFVVQVGTNYVVWDPAYSFDPAYPEWVYMVFDSRWTKLSMF